MFANVTAREHVFVDYCSARDVTNEVLYMHGVASNDLHVVYFCGNQVKLMVVREYV